MYDSVQNGINILTLYHTCGYAGVGSSLWEGLKVNTLTHEIRNHNMNSKCQGATLHVNLTA